MHATNAKDILKCLMYFDRDYGPNGTVAALNSCK